MPIEYLIGDKAYDSEEIHRWLIIEHGIKGIIPLREFKDKEEAVLAVAISMVKQKKRERMRMLRAAHGMSPWHAEGL